MYTITKLLNRLLTERETQYEFLKFSVVGSLSSLAYIIILYILSHSFGAQFALASIPSYLGAMVVNYSLQRFWTFGSIRPHMEALPRYLLTHLIGMFINWLGILLFYNELNMNFLVAQFISIALVSAWSYMAQKIWVFQSAA